MIKEWRTSKEYRTWRVQVIRRDKKCVICSSNQKREAHHINHSMYFVDLRFNIENGVTLCKNCHTQFHTNFKNSSKEKCDDNDFLNFKALSIYFRNLV